MITFSELGGLCVLVTFCSKQLRFFGRNLPESMDDDAKWLAFSPLHPTNVRKNLNPANEVAMAQH